MMRRMGRPGLMGTMARTAVIAGTATAVSGGVRSRQEQQAMAAQQAPAAPAPPPPPAPAAGLDFGQKYRARILAIRQRLEQRAG